MMKMDLGTGSGSKIFQLNDEDIELIVRLLHQESDHHVYEKDFGNYISTSNSTGETWIGWQGRYDHIQDLIMELTK